LRVIAVARKSLNIESALDIAGVESNLTFLGLFAMLDPPRAEVLSAVAKCRQAGIQVVMITGDYEVTAEAIARKVGIVDAGAARVITGAQLDRMTNQELVELITSDVVFARVSPEHKLRVVEAFQQAGHIVAVTGDGVNDAPALKKSDIGVAMGLCGTDVAREAADIILLDDNFASIVNAVEEGRAVYDNIKKFAVYVFNSNMAEAVPFVLMLLSCGLIPMPLTVMQVLSVDLGTDMVPAIGLGADTAQTGVMQRKPRSRKEPLLSKALLAKALLWYGAIESILSISGYFYINFLHGWPGVPLAPQGSEVWKTATTMTLTCIVTSQVGAVFCCRTQTDSVFSISPFNNRLIIGGVAFEIALLAALMYVPALSSVFDTTPLPPQAVLYAFTCIPVIILLDEVRKLFLRRKLNLDSGGLR
jgi:magnesium-transporting ATPase (P-type)